MWDFITKYDQIFYIGYKLLNIPLMMAEFLQFMMADVYKCSFPKITLYLIR